MFPEGVFSRNATYRSAPKLIYAILVRWDALLSASKAKKSSVLALIRGRVAIGFLKSDVL